MKFMLCTFILFAKLLASAQLPFTPVVPNSSLVAEGNSASTAPFDENFIRYQQVYAASQFGSVPGWIREIEFRVDAGGLGMSFFTVTLSNIQISASTTLHEPDSLSPVFADNLGLNNSIVRSGPLTISGRNLHAPGEPNPMEIRVPFTTPFFYDPGQGNLLLDVRNYVGVRPGAFTSPFDAVNSVGDPVSSLYAIGPDSISGTPSTIGLVTRFVIDPVPEPSIWTLVITGLGMFGLFKLRNRKAKS